ncbi:adenine nucleotide alpha hydrolase [Clostridia bacterium]|nr:adenine nucleotide alpha hydrolase [Clostridia bacterium]
MDTKYIKLQDILRNYGKVAVAYSAGVDSTLLLRAAKDALGAENVLAVTAKSPSFPEREVAAAAEYAKFLVVPHIITQTNEFDNDNFRHNPPNRCYLCKTELFTVIRRISEEHGIRHIAEGSNVDDGGDYRPGLAAVSECGIHSPLREAGLTKKEIRELSKELALPTWDKQSFACLSSRFQYGEDMTPDKIEKIDKAEQYLIDKGFKQIRVRYHDSLARIETDGAGFALLSDESLRRSVSDKFKEIGFLYTAIDILGYRTGSSNASLPL